MKKIISFLLVFIVCISIFAFVYAENNYTVKNNTVSISEDFLNINISVPYFDGFKESDKINKKLKDILADSIGEARTQAESLKQLNDDTIKDGEEPLTSKIILKVDYDYFLNDDIVSIQLNIYSYSGGAHGIQFIIPITMNTSTGEFYTFKDLFKEDAESIEIIENKLISTIDKYPDNYFEEYDDFIKDKNGDFDFYIDGNKLVGYFNPYNISPYATGIHRFVFEGDELNKMLKDDILNSMKNTNSLDTIRFNGINLRSQVNILSDDIPMLPLRIISESLGYNVSWNKVDGPIVEGKPIVDMEYKTIKGITYVPLQYFTDDLKENVSLESLQYINTDKAEYDLIDDTIVRIYKDDNEDIYYNLILEFKRPSTPIECVETYGNAVKMRNGAIQYALLSNDLRDKNYLNFKDHIFVTGQSSPWVDSYGIKELGDNSFQIIFHLATSVTTDKIMDTVANIKVVADGNSWVISHLETNQY